MRKFAADGKDYYGRELKVGQTVIQASRVNKSPVLQERTVARVAFGTVWLNPLDGSLEPKGSPQRYTGRLLIVKD